MNILNIEMNDCFGIHLFSKEFEFVSGQNTILIYAPNGTMKTSFAKALKCKSGVERGLELMDRIHPKRIATCSVSADGTEMAAGDIFVIDAEDIEYDSSKYCTTFLASQTLKDRYDGVYQELNEAIRQFTIDMGHETISSDCETEIISTFKIHKNDSFLDCLLSLKEQADGVYTLYSFKYDDVFDDKASIKIRKFLDQYSSQLDDYFTRYNELLEQSTFYRKNGRFRFGTKQATDLQKTVGDGAFFGVNHKIILADGSAIVTLDQLNEKINEDKHRLLTDAQLLRTFEQITKAIDANTELRELKNIIENDPSLLVELRDYDEFRKKYWLGHLFSDEKRERTKALIALYEMKLEEVRAIVAEAQQEQDAWKRIIDLYKVRFHVPFKVKLGNQEDVLLKNEVANLEFSYIDTLGDIDKKKKELIGILSKGEQRALYILQMLFEIEGRRNNPNDQLLIFDDIADSFDYQNKYAIIEYLKDINRDALGHFKCILLTHNFDFYRTVRARLGLQRNVYFADRSADGSITLSNGIYQYKTPFQNMQKLCNSNDRHYIAMIPFVRNLIEYRNGETEEYNKLTNCLHVKSDSNTMTDNVVSNIISPYYKDGMNIWSRADSGEKIYDMVMRVADSIVAENPQATMVITEKIVLSIAIRLLAEKYMISKLLSNGVDQAEIDAITLNQESALLQKCKDMCITVDYGVLERVNMMTPENIHINSFMYEPLVDMSITHLVQLYNDCKGLQ